MRGKHYTIRVNISKYGNTDFHIILLLNLKMYVPPQITSLRGGNHPIPHRDLVVSLELDILIRLTFRLKFS